MLLGRGLIALAPDSGIGTYVKVLEDEVIRLRSKAEPPSESTLEAPSAYTEGDYTHGLG